jgi:hypothetical protein
MVALVQECDSVMLGVWIHMNSLKIESLHAFPSLLFTLPLSSLSLSPLQPVNQSLWSQPLRLQPLTSHPLHIPTANDNSYSFSTIINQWLCGFLWTHVNKTKQYNVDIARQWSSLKDNKDRKKVVCDFCGQTTTGGMLDWMRTFNWALMFSYFKP